MTEVLPNCRRIDTGPPYADNASWLLLETPTHTHTHTHTHIYIYIYMYIYKHNSLSFQRNSATKNQRDLMYDLYISQHLLFSLTLWMALCTILVMTCPHNAKCYFHSFFNYDFRWVNNLTYRIKLVVITSLIKQMTVLKLSTGIRN